MYSKKIGERIRNPKTLKLRSGTAKIRKVKNIVRKLIPYSERWWAHKSYLYMMTGNKYYAEGYSLATRIINSKYNASVSNSVKKRIEGLLKERRGKAINAIMTKFMEIGAQEELMRILVELRQPMLVGNILEGRGDYIGAAEIYAQAKSIRDLERVVNVLKIIKSRDVVYYANQLQLLKKNNITSG